MICLIGSTLHDALIHTPREQGRMELSAYLEYNDTATYIIIDLRNVGPSPVSYLNGGSKGAEDPVREGEDG